MAPAVDKKKQRRLFGWCMTDQHTDCIAQFTSALNDQNYACECECHAPSKSSTGRRKTSRPKKK